MITSEEILEELCAQTDEIREFFGATFEVLEDYWAICDARLSAFSSDKMWVVAIEVVGYDPRGGEYSSRVWLFGNCIQERDDFYSPDFTHRILTVPNAWNKEIEKNQIWGFSREGFAFRFRGKRFDFAPTLDELKAAGIELSRRELESGELSPQQMLRFVCKEWEHPFFLSEDALRDLLDAKSIAFKRKYGEQTQRSWYENELGEFEEEPLLGVYLELILQTRDWIHPKVGMGNADAGEWEISPREAFEILAQTLSMRDLTVWNAQDKTKFNSHWRNWAEIEADAERAQIENVAGEKAKLRAYIESFAPEQRRDAVESIRAIVEDTLRERRETMSQLQSCGSFGLDVSYSYLDVGEWSFSIVPELMEELDALQVELDASSTH